MKGPSACSCNAVLSWLDSRIEGCQESLKNSMTTMGTVAVLEDLVAYRIVKFYLEIEMKRQAEDEFQDYKEKNRIIEGS